MLPPPLDGEARDRLLQAFGRISLFTDRVLRELGDEMTCRQGCDACCRQSLRLRGAEAAYLLEGARGLGAEAVSLIWKSLPSSGPKEACPLLHGGLCLVYEHRPAVCRTHGFPMIRREEEQTVLHHCPENFRGLDASRFSPSLILDEENLALLMDAVDVFYCRRSGWNGSRVPIGGLLRSGLQP